MRFSAVLKDKWEGLGEPMACDVCGGQEFDADPKWRGGTDAEKAIGWYRLPAFSPDRATCKSCGFVYEFKT